MICCCWCEDPFLPHDLIIPAEEGFHGAMHAECWQWWSRAFYPDLERQEESDEPVVYPRL